jgi:glutamate-1-semialdehyde 2,1-aminomutase
MKLAEAIRERVHSCEQVRFMNSGTEATSTAIRLARGATGRDRIVTFAGNFHGATDALLVAGGQRGRHPRTTRHGRGAARAAVAHTIVAPYNVVPVLDDTVAAVIVEPVAANMGVVAPVPGFPRGAPRRVRPGGCRADLRRGDHRVPPGPGGAQARYDVRPDLTCFGKVIGGGLPIGAVGGRRDVMEHLSAARPVFHAGTLAGNPLATAAGLAALNELQGDVYMELSARARHLASLLRDACHQAGLVATFPVVGTLVGIHLGPTEPTNFIEAKRTDERQYAALFHALLREQVALAPGAYEALFVGWGHDDDVLEQIGEAAARAAAAAVAGSDAERT